MSERSEKLHDVTLASIMKLKWLENLKSYEALKRGAIRNDHKHEEFWSRIKEFKIKYLDLAFSVSGEW